MTCNTVIVASAVGLGLVEFPMGLHEFTTAPKIKLPSPRFYEPIDVSEL